MNDKKSATVLYARFFSRVMGAKDLGHSPKHKGNIENVRLFFGFEEICEKSSYISKHLTFYNFIIEFLRKNY